MRYVIVGLLIGFFFAPFNDWTGVRELPNYWVVFAVEITLANLVHALWQKWQKATPYAKLFELLSLDLVGSLVKSRLAVLDREIEKARIQLREVGEPAEGFLVALEHHRAELKKTAEIAGIKFPAAR